MPSMPGMTMSVTQQVPVLVENGGGLVAVGAGRHLEAGALQARGPGSRAGSHLSSARRMRGMRQPQAMQSEFDTSRTSEKDV